MGDDIFDDLAHKESLNFTLRDGAKRLTNNSLKVIEEKGIEYALEKGLVKYESTIHKKFAEEEAVKKEILEKQKVAIQKSKEDPLYNYYLAVDGESRRVTIEKEKKPSSLLKSLKNHIGEATKEGYGSIINSVPNYDKWQETAKEYGEMESSLAGSALLQASGNLITVPGRMATEMNLFGPGEIQYGSVKDIRGRQQELNDVTRGKADLLTAIVAYSTVESIKDSKTFQKVKNKFVSLEYSKSVEVKATESYHKTPVQFDKYTMTNGSMIKRNDGRIEYMIRGYVNGKEGVYHITVRNENYVIHKDFIPKSDWNRYRIKNELLDYNKIK